MSWLSKKLKKIKIKNVAKAIKKASGVVTKVADYLPAPVGKIAKVVGKIGKGMKKGSEKKKKKSAGSWVTKIPQTARNRRTMSSVASGIKNLKKQAKR